MPEGRVWLFGDDVSTDLLSPGTYAVDPVEVRMQHCLESLNPNFPVEVAKGDIVVAGSNFGCGSSRETAPENLAALGVGCVVVESVARIFLRNAIAIGLPVMVCPGATRTFADGDRIAVDLGTGEVANPATGAAIQGEPLPSEMRQILDAGGILAVLRQGA